MWRGHPYADVESHGMLDGEITRLSEMRLSAQASRIDADLALGRHSELIGEIEALTVEHPYSERFRAQHMLRRRGPSLALRIVGKPRDARHRR
jgi:hypothetical protein